MHYKADTDTIVMFLPSSCLHTAEQEVVLGTWGH